MQTFLLFRALDTGSPGSADRRRDQSANFDTFWSLACRLRSDGQRSFRSSHPEPVQTHATQTMLGAEGSLPDTRWVSDGRACASRPCSHNPTGSPRSPRLVDRTTQPMLFSGVWCPPLLGPESLDGLNPLLNTTREEPSSCTTVLSG